MGDTKIRPPFAWAVAGYLSLGLFSSLTGILLAGSHRMSVQTVLSSGGKRAAITPQISHVYPVSPEVLAIEVAAPLVEKGKQMPYRPQPEDVLVVRDSQTRVERAGRTIGMLVGDDAQILYTYDHVDESALPVRQATAKSSYLIVSTEDANYATPTRPKKVFRKTKPIAFAHQSSGFSWPAAHTLFLTLPKPLVSGRTYRLSFPGLGIEDTDFDYQPTVGRSEAVHVSQLGFRPDDPLKVGYLSTWMGNGGGLNYPENLGFQLIEQQTNQSVYRGRASLVRDRNETEDPRDRDYTLSEVHRLDFSDFNQPGQYRLCVDGIGCSFAFEIAVDVWQKAFFTAARGFYHQRSGVAIGAPHTRFSRPRAFHPDDGVQVYQSGATLLDVDMGLGDRDTFTTLNSEKTEILVPDAWGGYFDAGDWDRRIQHLAVPRRLLELHNLFPNYFQSIDLNLPESANPLPDILDEALWSLDFFRRMQTPEGGIRGGIQSAAEGGVYGETSWQESLTVMAYAPDVWSSYLYAGVAARAAFTLQAYDEALANTYQESALRAMAYAENHYQKSDYQQEQQHHVKDQRNLAALELYRLTEERKWHDLFLATTVFKEALAEASVYGVHEQRDAAFLYARLNQSRFNQFRFKDARFNPSRLQDAQFNGPCLKEALSIHQPQRLLVNPPIQANARASFLRYADALVALTRTTAFGWSKDHPEAPIGWGNGLGAPHSVNILQAHVLTQNDKYLLAGLSSTQFAGGANPANMVFTTGLGDRSPQNPLIIDQRITRQAPPPGITVYGPADLSVYQNYWTIDDISGITFPKPKNWPVAENYFDIYLYPMGAEFTVDYMISPAYTWGYLAARES